MSQMAELPPDDLDLESPDLANSVAYGVARAGKMLRRHKPFPRVAKNDRTEKITEHMRYMYEQMMKKNAPPSNKWADGIKCIVPAAIRHSSLVVDLNELEPICFKDMTVNKVHKGKYLLCRALFNGYFERVSLNALVEDVNDEVETLNSTYVNRDYSLDPARLLPMYSILVIKEPYLASSVNNPDNYCIRVESPTDLVIISDFDYKEEYGRYLPDKWLKDDPFSASSDTYESLNAKGNKCFVDFNYHHAIRYYTKALNWIVKKKRSESRETKKTLNNRSMANLKLERFWPAYQDALRASQIVMDDKREERQMNEKSYYRMAKAMYCMRQFADSVIWFTKCVELNPENQDICAELAKARQRVKESETGEFDVGQIIKDARVNGIQRLDVADYMSPALEVTSLNNDPNYKGLIAKCDIKRNTLIMGTNYGSIAYENECDKYPVFTGHPVPELDSAKVAMPWQTQNLFNIVHRVQYDPFFAKKIYSLHAGPKIDRNKPISEFIVDTERLEEIVTNNAFMSDPHDEKKFVRNNSLWIYPCFFNHSCLPNVHYYMYADTILLYTMRDIKKGEELTISYSGLGYKKRQEVFKSFGFKCTCQLCQVDGNDPKVNTRAEFVKKRTAELSDGLKRVKKQPDLNLAEAFVAKVRGMYKAGHEPSLQFDMIEPLSLLACYLKASGHLNKSAEIQQQIFDQFKETDQSSALRALFCLIKCYGSDSQHHKQDVIKWTKKVKEYCIGHEAVFDHLLHSQLPTI